MSRIDSFLDMYNFYSNEGDFTLTKYDIESYIEYDGKRYLYYENASEYGKSRNISSKWSMIELLLELIPAEGKLGNDLLKEFDKLFLEKDEIELLVNYKRTLK